ncbi:MAG TPA: hypothetical protein DD429_08845, partial [Clostridiaceae bacterium]|nr:hypothetical protein [Clostridiaceae bacterium]
SRIPPLAQVRLNESIQKVSGVKETTDKYFLKSNIIKPNKIGLIILFIGIALMVISYIHPL